MNWQKELKKNIETIEQLKKYIKLSSKEARDLKKVLKLHPMSITRYYLSLIDVNDPNDPIRNIVVPSANEFAVSGFYDQSGEEKNTVMIGLQHKYSQTALLLATNECASYCRHCFRKRMIGLPNQEIMRRFNKAVDYIKAHKEINNVLISGGDPFVLPTNIIKKFLKKLSAIPHLDFIRFGTRTLVVFPDRILSDPELLNVLKKYSKKDKRIYIVTHYNHPREITERSRKAVDKLLKAGVIINNQTVLLKGVNDYPDTLAELQNGLVAIGVNPYYVFQCRPVKRADHFQIPFFHGCHVTEEAKKQLNGHSKRFKYMMSHKSGKIEILGIMGKYIYFKYHQAKNPKNLGKIFKRKVNRSAAWLDDDLNLI